MKTWWKFVGLQVLFGVSCILLGFGLANNVHWLMMLSGGGAATSLYFILLNAFRFLEWMRNHLIDDAIALQSRHHL